MNRMLSYFVLVIWMTNGLLAFEKNDSLKKVIAIAMEHSPQIKVLKLNVDADYFSYRKESAFFTPKLEFGFSISDATYPSIFSVDVGNNAATLINENYTNWRSVLSQDLPTATNIYVEFDTNKATTNSVNALISPYYNSTMRFGGRQNILGSYDWFGTGLGNQWSLMMIAKEKYKAVSLQNKSQLSIILLQIETAYLNSAYLSERIVALDQAIQVAEKQLKYVREKIKAGLYVEADSFQVEERLESRKVELIKAHQEYEASLLFLANLLGLSPMNVSLVRSLATTIPQFYDMSFVSVEEFIDRSFKLNPGILSEYKKLEAAKKDFKRQKGASLPKLDVDGAYILYGGNSISNTGYTADLSELIDTRTDGWEVGLTLSVPLGINGQRYDFKKSRVEYLKAQENLKRTELSLKSDIALHLENAKRNKELCQATARTRVLAEKKLAFEQKKLESGLTTNFQVLVYQQDLTDAKMGYLLALNNYHQSVAQLDFLMGKLPDDYGIKVSYDH